MLSREEGDLERYIQIIWEGAETLLQRVSGELADIAV